MRRSGFTLLEVAIVAAVILLLAGILVPQFSGMLERAQTDGTRHMLERARTAVQFYALQHENQMPGLAGGTWAAQTFLDQLMLATDEDGNTAAAGTPGFPFGPYLTEPLGSNPFNELDDLVLIAPGGSMGAPDDLTGWVFFAETGAFRANTAHETCYGSPVWDL